MTRTNAAHILVVDDDDRLRALLQKFLREQDFLVTTVADAAAARQALEWFSFDAMVLDVMMPGESGLTFLASLPQAKRPATLMLSAMGEAEDRIRGLEVGAYDYLPKPFEPKELVLRLRNLTQRMTATTSLPRTGDDNVFFGEYRFDLSLKQLRRGEEVVYLTSNELAMLFLLASRLGQASSREELSGTIPGGASERSVDVQITRLRKKIEPNPSRPLYIQTVRGAGYRLCAAPSMGDADV